MSQSPLAGLSAKRSLRLWTLAGCLSVLFPAIFPLAQIRAAAQQIAPAVETSSAEDASENPIREDLSKLADVPLPPYALKLSVIERDEMPEFTREFIRAQWRTGDPIDLYIIRPVGVAKPPVTLFLYGFPSETDRFRNDEFCKIVTGRGYAAVGFVSALTGHRFHGRGLTEWFVSDLRFSLVATVHDVERILDYLESRPDLDTSQIGMLGQGSGGAIAILAASVDPRLKRIEMMDPWGDWPNWLAESAMILEDERPRLNQPEFLKQVADLDPVKILPKIDSSRLHLLDVQYDRDTPPKAKRNLESAMPPHAEIEIYNTPRDFQNKVIDGNHLLDWLQPNRKNSADSGEANTGNSKSVPSP